MAIAALGESVELAMSLRKGIEVLSRVGRPPIAPHRPGFDPEAWKTLVAYLIEERRLIEFVLGPSVAGKQGANLRYLNPDDLCLDCFRQDDVPPWRFPDDEARIQLHTRAGRINKRLTHFSWTLAGPDSRLDAGLWNTHYIDQVVDGLGGWSDWLETNGSVALAKTLRRSINPDILGRHV